MKGGADEVLSVLFFYKMSIEPRRRGEGHVPVRRVPVLQGRGQCLRPRRHHRPAGGHGHSVAAVAPEAHQTAQSLAAHLQRRSQRHLAGSALAISFYFGLHNRKVELGLITSS